jgi:hypothetical protein
MAKSCPERLIEYFHGQEETADALRQMVLDVNPGRMKTFRKQTVHSWKVQGFIPEIYAPGVERLTKGTIRAEEIMAEANRVRRERAAAKSRAA